MEIPWWRDAVVYEIYVRSFADASGDGVGDLPGIRQRLPYLAELGVDAIWLTPFYPSPMADGGYDVADYRDVDPLFGTLADFDALVTDAHALGLRVLVDIVPNHSSAEHPCSGRRCGVRAGTATSSATAETSRPTTGSRPSAARRGRRRPTGSGTFTCSHRSSPTSTGAIPRYTPSSSTC